MWDSAEIINHFILRQSKFRMSNKFNAKHNLIRKIIMLTSVSAARSAMMLIGKFHKRMSEITAN